MSNYQVRPAQDDDAEAIAQVHADSLQAAYPDLAHDATPQAKRRKFWLEAIEFGEPLLQVVLDGDTIVGFAGFDRSRDPKSRPTTGELWAMYVRPSHWNRGVGLALWDATREALIEEGCTEVTIWVPLRNDRALRFFELAGFKRQNETARTALHGSVKLEELRLRRALD
jgi:ribosomal protein S18 acetylase RimI-like enzyme